MLPRYNFNKGGYRIPTTPSYPGIYFEESPDGVRPITGVATSITAFIGRAKKGPVDEPVLVQSFAEYERKFGGLWMNSTMSYAVQHYFIHGGEDALIVRVINRGSKATITLPADTGNLVLEATDEGDWGKALRVAVDHDTRNEDSSTLFNLTIQELSSPGSSEVVSSETFCNLSPDSITKVLEQQSSLVRVEAPSSERPHETVKRGSDGPYPPDFGDAQNYRAADQNTGSDGIDIGSDQIISHERKGLYALDKDDQFNLLCIPPFSQGKDVDINNTLTKAARYCRDHRAMLIVDPPSTWNDVGTAKSGTNSLRSTIGNDIATNVAVYFPRLIMANHLKGNQIEEFVPCGAIAGIFARIDAQRCIWKAPAGVEASFSGVQEFTYKLTDRENRALTRLGINCLRSFPECGNVVWGARTLAGADQLASEWKYIPVRRLALYIEESIYRGTHWAVFEPNDEPLWAQIRLNVGAFMHNLFRQGAFQGSSPREAYFVKCNEETTTRNDIDQGIVNILVGFAPLKPAKFVIIKIQQMAGNVR